MNSERIREIQKNTAYPESISVHQALLQVWAECEQIKLNKAPNLQLILSLDNPWCLRDVLKKLIESSEILLNDKNYDGHGWEEISHCVERAKEIIHLL